MGLTTSAPLWEKLLVLGYVVDMYITSFLFGGRAQVQVSGLLACVVTMGRLHALPATLKDVSELGGVSQSTVSRVLSGAYTVVPIGALNSAQAAGWHVPRDLSVVGSEHIPFAAYTVPALTTVRQPIGARASLAVDIALRRAADPEAPLETHWLDPELVIRNSTMQAATRKEVLQRK
jgi:hypothetical protein